jgi:hypothetical protein
MWRRTFFQRHGHSPDQRTEVTWLQAPRFFADIRQPEDRPSFRDAACLRDLQSWHMRWLARQEAFAGELLIDGDVAHWVRLIDYQPDSHVADRARVTIEGNMLIETGMESDYLEHWQRIGAVNSTAGAKLVDNVDGRKGFLVWHGDTIMVARARTAPLPPGHDLSACLRAGRRIEEKQDLFDFEVSLGKIDVSGRFIVVERSTLPFKEGKKWAVRFVPSSPGFVEIEDVDADGNTFHRSWRIEDCDQPEEMMKITATWQGPTDARSIETAPHLEC